MDKIDSSVFVMTVNDQGQNVYTDQSDPTKSYIFDDEGNITDFGETDGASSIKMESNLELEENNSTEMEHLEDSSQLEMMSNLGHVFEDTLMDELDTDLMKRETAFESNCIMQHMDIREPLSKLKKLLEARLSIELPGFLFCLQGSQMLESHKTLVDQCVQGEGLVQVNLQIQANLKRINIIDVLKPADDYIEEVNVVEENTEETTTEPVSKTTEPPENNNTTNKVMTDKVVQWQLDLPFKREQERLKIPTDPKTWNILHVRHWVQWAVRQFNLPNIKLSDWSITGGDLYRLTIQDFQRMAPQDNNDIFWTHFELLRKMKVVATIKEGPRYQPPTLPPPSSSSPSSSGSNRATHPHNHHHHHHRPNLMKQSKINRVVGHYSNMTPQSGSNVGVTSMRSSHNGQIQLWQFLLEMLTSRECRHMIAWEGTEGEFKLLQPEQVATLWGDRKNKPTMNYEKLSRALRYYYDGDMISKVQGKRFVYKFVCDLRQVLGYSALELARLIDIGNPLREGTGEDLQEPQQDEEQEEEEDVYDGE